MVGGEVKVDPIELIFYGRLYSRVVKLVDVWVEGHEGKGLLIRIKWRVLTIWT